MIELTRKLHESSNSLLLYMQNILKISMYHLKANASDGSDAE